jgi:C2H2-type zinc finger
MPLSALVRKSARYINAACTITQCCHVLFVTQEHHAVERKVYNCDICRMSLSSQRALRVHRKRRHRKELRAVAAAAGGQEKEGGESGGEDKDSDYCPPKKRKKPSGASKRLFRCKFCAVIFLFKSIFCSKTAF